MFSAGSTLDMIAALKAVFALLVLPFTVCAYDLTEDQMMNGLRPGDLEKAALDETRVLLANNTWTPFIFTNAGSYGRPFFKTPVFTGNTSLEIQFADVFCAGDRFTMYLNNSDTGLTFSQGSLPFGSPSCNTYTLDPDIARLDPAFCQRDYGFVNPTGEFNITMVATLSPFSAGKAYIRASYPPNPF